MAKTNGTINFDALKDVPRLLMECELKPLQGHRFQPTGFADLGPARYTAPDGTEMLLVESAQSVANRLEAAIWDDAADDLIEPLRGLPYILVKECKDGIDRKLTNSILESHRINSPYILEGADRKVFDQIKNDAAALEIGPVRLPDLARLVFKYDANAVLHGVFLSKKELAGGRLRMTRILSGFIEAARVSPAEIGGVKNDRVDPSGNTAQGFGNIPFHRTEFTAQKITGYFNLDLALLRGYGLGHDSDQSRNGPFQWSDAEKLLIALSLFKIRRFLSTGLRLRTACDLEPEEGWLRVTRPGGFVVPDEASLLAECQSLISACSDAKLFAGDHPHITEVEWKPVRQNKAKKGNGQDDAAENGPDDQEKEDQ